MIDCPKCGTANRAGSSFCSQCGAVFGEQVHIACPECGTLNPIQNANCSECQEPLPSSPASTRESDTTPTDGESTRPTADASAGQDPDETPAHTPAPEEEAPAWLSALGAALPADHESDETEFWDDKSEVPDWLEDLRASLPDEPESEQDLTVEEAPDWLAALRRPAQPEESEPTTASEAETPDWLAELRSVEAGEVEGAAPELSEEQPSDWLSELPRAADQETEPALEAGAGETPDWLAELRSSFAAERAEPDLEIEEEPAFDWMAELPPAGEEEMPDWLAELQPAFAEVAGPEEQEGPESELLDELELLSMEGEEETGPPLLPEIEPGEIPDWMAALQEEATEEGLPPDEDLFEVEGPEWLVPTPPEAEEEPLARAEIPAWLLALKPAELRAEEEGPGPEVEEPADATGILAGLQGILPVEMIIAQPRAVSLTEALEAPLSDTPQARLFADVVGQPPAAAPREIAHAPSRGLDLVPRWLIYVALLVAVGLPLLLGETLVPVSTELLPATENLYDSLQALDSGSPVLVAFDYDPTASGEMDALAEVLVGHLMNREARVIAVSLFPAGPAMAGSMLDQLAAERVEYDGSYGQRYANLGYVPGQATAVRLLSLSLETALPRDFYGMPLSELAVMEGLSTAQDFDLILELAANQDTLRSWIEQASTPYDIPFGAGVSASVEPLARPYYETGRRQLIGIVAGVPGAAAYQELLGGQDTLPDDAAARLQAQTLGYLVFVLILVIGNILYLLRRGGRREQ
jgi:hypothetical protein